mgnify:CR=1 FL=1
MAAPIVILTNPIIRKVPSSSSLIVLMVCLKAFGLSDGNNPSITKTKPSAIHKESHIIKIYLL